MSPLTQWLHGDEDDKDFVLGHGEYDDESYSDDNDEIVIMNQWWINDEDKSRTRNSRNRGRRPGGTNANGLPHYWDSMWGRILRYPELQVSGSPLRKVFGRRFRVPYPMYMSLVEWTKGWHVRNE